MIVIMCHVGRMLHVLMKLGTTAVNVIQDSLEMDTTVLVRSTALYRTSSQFCALGNCRHQ